MGFADRPGVNCIQLQPLKNNFFPFIDQSLSTSSSQSNSFLTVSPHLTSPHKLKRRDSLRMEEVEENQEMKKVQQNPSSSEEEEEELELGLSLGAKKFTSCNATSNKSTCRILTAKDFHPAGVGGPTSSASSSSSSVGSGGGKRAKPGPASPDGGSGSSQQPSSQMVVGWPPVKQSRMTSLFNLSKDHSDQNSTKNASAAPVLNGEKNKEKEHIKEEEKKLGSRNMTSPFVKVKMDGDPIGRKIDLHALASYNALASVLELMFQKPGLGSSSITKLKLLEESSEYKLTYEDKEGDWMLVGDVPWR
ncbi:hypothetical protein LUZ61_018231 [Rhynchospora tenuis]|uniref:Auxin-responsive protein n=1 Tax=Rhynchospora tenuis TaxID=198213 RepID=A0AAD5Z8W7_9POAL|nr:hypothetical protein LUZ61_018231 [Rhynchospora tenuis]